MYLFLGSSQLQSGSLIGQTVQIVFYYTECAILPETLRDRDSFIKTSWNKNKGEKIHAILV